MRRTSTDPRRPKTIAGKRVRVGDLKVAAMLGVFATVPCWDLLLCYGWGWYFGMTMFALVRGCVWALLSFSITTQQITSSLTAVGSAVAAFLVLVPVEMIYFMSIELYPALYIAALLRLIAAFGITVAIAAAKSFI